MMEKVKIILVFIIYISFLIDNILLTVVVPILPDFLYASDLLLAKKKDVLSPLSPGIENTRVAILLSSKALVQLIANPFVGVIITKYGSRIPLLIGSFFLLFSSGIFAMAQNYAWLFFARSLHGIASALIGVSGMSTIAENFTCELSRSRAMGTVLGSVALGVLLGYPLGGMLYDLAGKSAPFILICILSLISIVIQYFVADTRDDISIHSISPSDSSDSEEINLRSLLNNNYVLICSGAIFISTSAMSILEPCLPLWMMENLHPEKWQLGTVFIPDSIGYLIGTNFFGTLAYDVGRGKVGFMAMLLVGIAAAMIPNATNVVHLMAPHFAMGLGIGMVDAALVPLLARVVDTYGNSSSYGNIYVLQQIAVSLAYFLGPLLGGLGVKYFGFPWLMRLVGFLNLIYCPLLLTLITPTAQQDRNQVTIVLGSAPNFNTYATYQRFD